VSFERTTPNGDGNGPDADEETDSDPTERKRKKDALEVRFDFFAQEVRDGLATFLTEQVNIIAALRAEVAKRDEKLLTAYAQGRREYQELRAGMLNMGAQVGRLDQHRPVSKADLEAVRSEVERTRESLAEIEQRISQTSVALTDTQKQAAMSQEQAERAVAEAEAAREEVQEARASNADFSKDVRTAAAAIAVATVQAKTAEHVADVQRDTAVRVETTKGRYALAVAIAVALVSTGGAGALLLQRYLPPPPQPAITTGGK
jgi:chromosome segregation ATPase